MARRSCAIPRIKGSRQRVECFLFCLLLKGFLNLTGFSSCLWIILFNRTRIPTMTHHSSETRTGTVVLLCSLSIFLNQSLRSRWFSCECTVCTRWGTMSMVYSVSYRNEVVLFAFIFIFMAGCRIEGSCKIWIPLLVQVLLNLLSGQCTKVMAGRIIAAKHILISTGDLSDVVCP